MSLVTIAKYRSVTGDETSATGTLQPALDDAEDLLEEFLRRPLHFDGTERLRLYDEARGSVAYPSAVPIIDAADYTIAGHGLIGASPTGGPFDQSDPAYAEIAYEGGWTEATLPESIARDVSWAAYSLMRPGSGAAVPVGASAASVGDASVSFGAGGAPARAESGVEWSRATRRWKRRLP